MQTNTDVDLQYEDQLPAALKKLDHLQQASSEIYCPSCHVQDFTNIKLEAVTRLQKIATSINFCLRQ